MCWAAADRAARIARRFRPEHADELGAAAHRIRDLILKEAIDPRRNCLTADHGGNEVDAALLQAVTLNLLPHDDPRMIATVECVRGDLDHGGWLRRYRTVDDFGVPSVAFTICTFWLVDALARIGKVDDARIVMERVRAIPNPLGLLSEDVDPSSGVMWGNYPQAYSHVGLIHGAFAVAPRWSEVG
jgi:GH15 family glucan-1,4-alpha-glucosidase